MPVQYFHHIIAFSLLALACSDAKFAQAPKFTKKEKNLVSENAAPETPASPAGTPPTENATGTPSGKPSPSGFIDCTPKSAADCSKARDAENKNGFRTIDCKDAKEEDDCAAKVGEAIAQDKESQAGESNSKMNYYVRNCNDKAECGRILDMFKEEGTRVSLINEEEGEKIAQGDVTGEEGQSEVPKGNINDGSGSTIDGPDSPNTPDINEGKEKALTGLFCLMGPNGRVFAFRPTAAAASQCAAKANSNPACINDAKCGPQKVSPKMCTCTISTPMGPCRRINGAKPSPIQPIRFCS